MFFSNAIGKFTLNQEILLKGKAKFDKVESLIRFETESLNRDGEV